MKYFKGVFLIIMGVGAMLAIFLSCTRNHWWLKESTASVLVDGKPANGSCVYRSWDDNYLVFLRLGERRFFYIVNPKLAEIVIPNADFFFLPGCLFSRNAPPIAAPYGKTGREAGLKITKIGIEFYSHENLIRISLQER